MTGRHSGTRRAACAAAVVLGVTGGSVLGGGAARADDGIDKLSAQQIADRSRDALLSARSLHLSARGELGDNSPPMALELTLDRDGNCTGSVDLGKSQGPSGS